MPSTSLRIAVWYNLPSGGAKRALYNHLAGLRARGHYIEAFRPPVKEIEFMPIAEVAVREQEFPWESWVEESWFYPKKLSLASQEVRRYIKCAEDHARLAAESIRKGNFDILFANTDLQFHAPHIGRHINLPKVLYLQEPKRPFYEPLPRLPWLADDPTGATGLKKLKQEWHQWVNMRSVGLRGLEELENAKSYDKILVNSFFSRESVLRAYGLNGKVCYLGLNSEMFKNLDLPRENFVMGIGTLGPTKNVLLAIEAVGRIPKEIRPALVWVANMTDASYRDACVARSAQLDVEFTPLSLIPDDEVVSLLNRAMMMVYAPRLEPFGFAPLEANLCGLPVVAVAEGGIRETVVDGVNGLLVDHDPEMFAGAIIKLIHDKEQRLKLGSQGLDRALEIWGLEPSIDRLEAELYDTVNSRKV